MTTQTTIVSQVWYVAGDPNGSPSGPNLFQTKMDAEVYARGMFPDEDEARRYCRIFFREVYGSRVVEDGK